MTKWIKTNEKIPSCEDWVMISNGERIWLGQLENHGSNIFYCKCCLENLAGVTHWMPLPDLPND